MMVGSSMTWFSTILVFISLASGFFPQVVMGSPFGANTALLHMERIGIPFPSWTAPAYGWNATEQIVNPHLTRSAHLAPRFHRMLRYGQDKSAKTQTAIFVAGRSSDDEVSGRPGASIISALNPRDGGIVWRTVRNETDPIQSMHLSSDVLVTISGIKELRVSLLHALTGFALWSTPLPTTAEADLTGLFDAVFIPPAYLRPAETSSVAALAPDVVAMDRAGSVTRFAGINGAIMWKTNPISLKQTESQVKSIIPIKLHSDKKHVIVASLVQSASKGLLSSSTTHILKVDIFQAQSGATLTSFEVPNSDVEMGTTYTQWDTTGNVVIVGRDAEQDFGRNPHLVWLQTDGTVRSFDIPLPSEASQVQIDTSAIRTEKPKQASRYQALIEVAALNNRGILLARTNNGRAEAFRIAKKEKYLKSFWEMEEEAWDSVYSGGVDRQGQPYLNRVFFGRAQHLLHFHTMWLNKFEEQGQVTGASFSWDHDLNGDVLAAPFEVSPISDYQLIWRAAFVTRSSSIRMVQDEKHEWIREEGLSHTTASIMIDLPESKVNTVQGSDARAIIEGEGFIHRLERHLIALQSLPAWTAATFLKLAEEIPKLSLDSFGITPPKTPTKQGEQKKPAPTGAAPLRGVGAQKVGSKGDRPGQIRKMGGTSPGKKTPKVIGKADEGPPPPAYLAPREANATVTKSLVRDAFGFRKLIISISKSGKIYAIDSQTGQFIWEKSLFGFGQGEGSKVPTVDVELLALVRPIAGSGSDISSTIGQQVSSENVTSHLSTSQLDYKGLITVVATVQDEGATMTRMWEIEPLTGKFPGGNETQTGLGLFPGKAKDAFLLPIEDEKSGQIAAAAVSDRNKIMIWPTTESVQKRFAEIGPNFYYAVQETVSSGEESKQMLVGYMPVANPEITGQKAWQLPFPVGEEVVSVTRAVQDPVASQGKVLGNRNTLYKYLNPHLLLVVTRNKAKRSSTVYIVDGINGKIVHQSFLANGNLALKADDETRLDPIAVLTENWATISFSVDIPADDPQARYKGAHRQSRLISIEMYQPLSDEDEIWNWRGVFSSFASFTKQQKSSHVSKLKEQEKQSVKPITVYSQLYVLPYGVRAIAATRTKLGISSKAIVLATDQNRLQVLPRRMLDPRRPMGRKATAQEMEEGLITYDAELKDNGKFHLGGKQVPLPKRIHLKPSLLESTSVVFVDQALDFFVTTVAPSGSFDLLSASFNKLQLLLTIAVLTLGLFITKPMVSSKMLRMRW